MNNTIHHTTISTKTRLHKAPLIPVCYFSFDTSKINKKAKCSLFF